MLLRCYNSPSDGYSSVHTDDDDDDVWFLGFAYYKECFYNAFIFSFEHIYNYFFWFISKSRIAGSLNMCVFGNTARFQSGGSCSLQQSTELSFELLGLSHIPGLWA